MQVGTIPLTRPRTKIYLMQLRRPGSRRGRANRFGNSTESGNEYSRPGRSNGYTREVNSGGRFGRGDGRFGRRGHDSNFTRGDNS